jgi:Rrf2 family protein
MLISRTGQYAIQALVYIGLQGPESFTNVHDLSKNIGVPAAYLAKVMQILGHHDLVKSNRGRSGGFGLKIAPENINLLQVLLLIEGENFHTECLLGLKKCSDETACPMHSKWKPIKTEILATLEEQTIAYLADAVREGKYRLADLPSDRAQ